MINGNNYKVTVFIPTWFGEKYLNLLLDRVLKQKVDFKFEVLIIDTSSKDNSINIIKKFQKKYNNIRYEIISKKEFSHGKTRQDAAQKAKGDIVVYLTQDAIPAHHLWLYELTKPFFISENIKAVIGKQIPRPECFPLLKYEIQSVFSNLGPDFGTTIFYKDKFHSDQAAIDALSFYSDVNSAARREVILNQVKYRDVYYAEDQLFGRDLINAGLIKAYAPRGSVVHSNDLKLLEYHNRIFDEVIGLRRIGINFEKPSLKLILILFPKGIIGDTFRLLRDKDYSLLRKIYFLFINPIFHFQKWRGVILGAKAKLDDDKIFNKNSLESIKQREFEEKITNK